MLPYLGQVNSGRGWFEEALISPDLFSLSAQSNFFIGNIGNKHEKEIIL